jgi:hypothetical protein
MGDSIATITGDSTMEYATTADTAIQFVISPELPPQSIDTISRKWLEEQTATGDYLYVRGEPEFSLLEQLWRLFMEWLRDVYVEPSGIQAFAYYVVIIVVIAGGVYLLYKYGFVLPGQGRGRRVGIEYGIEELEDAKNYERLVGEAVSKAQYADAIRYLYLQVLAEAQEAQLVVWRPDKTDAEYLAEFRASNAEGLFRQCIRWFHRSWYGKELVVATSYQMAESEFRTLLHVIRGQS